MMDHPGILAGGAYGMGHRSNKSAGLRAWLLVLPLLAFIAVTFMRRLAPYCWCAWWRSTCCSTGW